MPVITLGRGFTPVGVVLDCAPGFNLHNGNFDCQWTHAYGNTQSYPALAALPAGIGFTNPLNGTTSDLTFTTAGVWSYTIGIGLPAADATLVGFLHSTIGIGLSVQFGPVSAAEGANWDPTISEILVIGAAGDAGGFNLVVPTVATTDPYTVNPTLTIVRLA